MESNPYEAPLSETHQSSSARGISAAVIDQLHRTRGWTLFIGILLLIGAGFLVLGGVAMMLVGGTAFSQTMGAAGAGMGIGLGLVYILMAALYIYPAIKLIQFFKSVGKLSLSGTEPDLVTALEKQRQFWKFAGISFIVMVVLYIVLMVVMIGAGIFAQGAGGLGM